MMLVRSQERADMPPSRTRVLVSLGLVLATVAATLAADGGQHGDGDGDADAGRPRTDARTVSGTISAVAWSEAKVTVDAADGPVTLHIDRNTAVFLENRLGSTHDLVLGTPVRATFVQDNRAVWVEVRPRAPTRLSALEAADGGLGDAGSNAGPPSLPPQPSVASAPDGGTDAGAQAPQPADAGPPARPSGNGPAGPSPPEPNPGSGPPRPLPPGPSGPGPVPIGPAR